LPLSLVSATFQGAMGLILLRFISKFIENIQEMYLVMMEIACFAIAVVLWAALIFSDSLMQRLEGFKDYLGLAYDASVDAILDKLEAIKRKARKKNVSMQSWLYRLKDKDHVTELYEVMKERDPTLVEYFNW
jgi:hypothetical protein